MTIACKPALRPSEVLFFMEKMAVKEYLETMQKKNDQRWKQRSKITQYPAFARTFMVLTSYPEIKAYLHPVNLSLASVVINYPAPFAS
ncbi:MAG TPA: hypothetical protein VFR58_16340 [Flavisolibacter sp.]|nr:hypothetical protein [Flavisolibacter sp.]